MLCRCTHSHLVDALGLEGAAAYQNLVRPLDYEFGLSKGREYQIFGLLSRKANAWLYVVESDATLLLAPAVLFEVLQPRFPSDMAFRKLADGSSNFEVVPATLLKFEDWFERYANDDAEVCAIVALEIRKLLK
jgi:hypothetical protein